MKHKLPVFIGLIFLVLSTIGSIVGLLGHGGIPSVYIPVSVSGLDLLGVTLLNSSLTALVILNVVACTLFGVLLGIVFSRQYSVKIKLVVCLIVLVIFAPLSIYSHYLKSADANIFSQSYSGGWYNYDASTCGSLSVYSKRRKSDCYLSLSRTSAVSVEICNKIDPILTDREACYNRLNKNTGM